MNCLGCACLDWEALLKLKESEKERDSETLRRGQLLLLNESLVVSDEGEKAKCERVRFPEFSLGVNGGAS